ncbi:MAG: cation transporter dimerization domain-containing protein, partial [Verrucomicrobiota bacterium]
LTYITGWLPLDPICAVAVALHILYTGVKLVRESVNGLMDTADPVVDESVTQILQNASQEFDLQFHNLKHLNTGDGHRLEVHLLFEDELTIQQVHSMATIIEDRLRLGIEGPTHIITHLEPKRAHATQHAVHDS